MLRTEIEGGAMSGGGKWTGARVMHRTFNGEPVTLKLSTDGQDALIARGHLQDIQPGDQHVHVWDLSTGDFRLHDMRLSRSLLPNVRDDAVNRPTPRDDARYQDLVSRAQNLARSGAVDAQTVFSARELDREWKSAGKASPANHHAFRAAMDEVFAANKLRIERLKAEWAANRSAKERLVSQAESLAAGSDLRAASDRMKSLGDEWKRIGPCEKSDNDQLWTRFNAARSRLRDRKEQEFNKRKAEWAANRGAKERLVNQMNALASSSDYRAAKDSARSLSDQWRAVGPCDKTDNDRLWNDFKSAKDRLFEAAKRDVERRNAEWKQRAWERVSRLEDQLRNTEAALYRAQESYSRALSARSPSMNNPNWMTIVRNQQDRQTTARAKIISLEQRKSDLISKLMDARSKAN